MIFMRISTKRATYHKNDLDEDLANYLTECVHEIGLIDFVIRFVFEFYPSDEFMLLVYTSVQKLFFYQRELELGAMDKDAENCSNASRYWYHHSRPLFVGYPSFFC